ncbi:two-component regulator propeller domain-containing protein [Inhella sp.]|uniref:sensor histidine kinase n=1 Tax=Inhella sp. TaxID=1921806 RepID=UPI0035B0F1CD
MRRLVWLGFALVLAMFGLPAARAATDWSALARPAFRHLGFDEGLPHPIVTALAQDRVGFLWIGTQGGLARYDGHRLRRYPGGDGPGALADPNIQALHVDAQGRLWVATRGAGLLRHEPESDRFLPVPALGLQGIWALLDEGPDALWLASEAGLLRLQQGQAQAWPAADPLAPLLQAPQRALARAADGSLWVGGALGLVHIRQGRAERVGPATGITALLAEPDGTLWVGSSAGLGRVTPAGAWETVWPAEHPQLSGRGVQALLRVAPDELWVAGYGNGVARFPGPAAAALRHDPYVTSSLASDGVRALLRDRSGLVWLGTDQGLDRHDPQAQGFVNLLHSPRQPEGLADRHVVHIGAGPTPEQWLLGYGGQGLGLLSTPADGPARLLPLQLDSPGAALPLQQQRVLASVWQGQHLWVGTLQGLYRVDWAARRAERVALPSAQPHPRVDALMVDRAGGLWVGSTEGLLRQRPGGFELLRHEPGRRDSLPHNRVNALLQDQQGRIWVGSNGGLSRWLGEARFANHVRDLRRPDSFCHSDAVSLREDAKGRLWIATLGGGLCLLQDEAGSRFRHFGRAEGLPHDNVGGLQVDGQGLLWASSADGLFSLEPNGAQLRSFGLSEGVAVRSFWVDSAARTAQGELLFGGGGGLVVVRPSRVPGAAAAPPLVVSSLRVDGQRRHLPASGLRLAPGLQSLQIEFSALDFRAAERLRYRHRLLGLEEAWTEGDASQRVATFSRLPPGRYELELQAALPGEDWSAALRVPVEQLPAWWQTWWARALALLAVALALAGLVQLRTRSLQRQRQVLEAEVAQRTQELSTANATLARSADTLSLLGDTGKALTAQLDLQAICATLHRQLARLLPVDAFGVALLEPDGRQLRFPYYFEDRLVQGDTVQLDDPLSLSARAFREDRELDVLDEQSSEAAPEVEGIEVGEPMRSLVFRPLTLNEERIGIVTMQSRRAQAYGPQELDIFRSLVAYAAIAIGNARAFAALQQAQAQLVEHAKLASLGQLVAGVAHEVNTPLGIAVTASSHLLERTQQVQAELQAQRLSRGGLAGFLQEAEHTGQVLEQNLRRAAGLIEHFKEVSVDRTSDGQRRFELGPYLDELLESLRPSWKHRPVGVECAVEPGLWMDSFPGALGQVLSNLVQNALLHAFAPEQPGQIRIRAERLGESQLRLEVADDGRGIPAEHLARVFDPFFTTKRGQGGTGLGLHISYNLVVQKLQGLIRVHSAPGQGCRFELLLPCVLAPAARPEPGT